MNIIKNIFKELNPYDNFNSLNKNIKDDIIAGITVGIIALPLALAFGEISNLGPVAGILGAIISGIIGGLFGGSKFTIAGPTAPTASQVSIFMGLFIISDTGQSDLVSIFSIISLSGLFMIIFSMLNVSKYIHFIPYSVVAGFMCGIGTLIIFSQTNAFFGLDDNYNILSNFEKIDFNALYIAVPCLCVMILWPKIRGKIKFFSSFPTPLLALIIGTLISYMMNLDIYCIGDKMSNAGNNQNFNFYIPDINKFFQFILPAISLAGLIIIDSLLTCVIADNLTSSKHSSNREIFGQGLSNLFAGFSGAVPTATATMFTVSNIKFGGKTILSSIVYGLTLLAILLGAKPLVQAIPLACIASILFKIGLDILDYRILPILRKLPKSDLLIFSLVLFITIYYDIMIAVLIGVLIAVINFIKYIKFSYKHNLKNLENTDINFEINSISNSNIKVIEIDGPLFFGSIESVLSICNKIEQIDLLLIDLRKLTKLDLSGVFAIEDIVKKFNNKKVKVIVIKPNKKNQNILSKVNFERLLDKYYIHFHQLKNLKF